MRGRPRIRRAPACPTWCVVVHRGDRMEQLEGLRLHNSTDHGITTTHGPVHVEAVRTDDLTAGRRGRVGVYVRVEDDLSVDDACRLAAALLNAVDTLRGAS